MMAHVRLIAGAARSGKTEKVLALYRAALAAQIPNSTLWLAPTWRAAAAIRDRLLDESLDGCFSPGVMTFGHFAEAVLAGSPEVVRPLGDLHRRRLVRRLLDEQLAARRLEHFRPIAATAGLVDLIGDFIREMKRLDIWPERLREACQARGMTQKDEELLAIYEAYQERLTKHNLYDTEGRFWSARELLRRTMPGRFGQLRLVVVDGFTDFTPPEHEIFQILAERVEQLWITLPLEEGPRRPDLFSKPLATLAELRRRHPGLIEEKLDRRHASTAWPAMDHLERTLFLNPRLAEPAPTTVGIEILAASRQLGGIELIGSRIKRLLCQGDEGPGAAPVPPGDIAVVFRSLGEADQLVREVFGRLGIPFAVESGQTLQRSMALAAFVGLVRLDVDDWPFRDLLAVLSNSCFRPQWPEWREGAGAQAAERVIRRLQIPRGRDRLIEQLTYEAARSTPRDHTGKPASEAWRSQVELALELLVRLRRVFEELPRRATLSEWAAAWGTLAAETGLLGTINEGSSRESLGMDLPDRVAWDRLISALGADVRLAEWLAAATPAIGRREALAALQDTLRSVPASSTCDESGRVRVLSAASVRALKVPYLFCVGLAEKSFPLAERQDQLYSEAERRRLIGQRLPLVDSRQRNREEMLLFYEVLTRATRRLYLSYPALDEKAQPLSPSPYLEEVEQSAGPGRITRTEVPGLSPVPSDDDPLARAEFRIKAVATALEGDVSLLAGLARWPETGDLASNILAGLHVTQQRRDRTAFGPAEGMLTGTAARECLAARFGPETIFSATELERYATCPYRFFLEEVLRVEPIEELALAVDYTARGRLVHAALAALHCRINQEHGGPTSPAVLDAEEFQLLLNETLSQVLSRGGANPIDNALREIDKRLWQRWAADYRKQHERYDALWTDCERPLLPTWFEVSFGRSEDGGLSTTRPLELDTPAGTIHISGRVDRIDTGAAAGRTVFNVVDYKTGSSIGFSADSVAAGTTLQLPLYAMAAEKLLLADRDAVGLEAGYWYVRDKGFPPKQALKMADHAPGRLEPTAQWESLRQTVAETGGVLVRAIGEGQFPVSSAQDDCTRYCPFSTICRINQIRSLEKRWQPST